MSIEKLYERHDSPTKGRHLIATQNIQNGQIIFVERPLLSLQSLGNGHQGALVCRRCQAFIGGPDICLAVASGRVGREEVFDHFEEMVNGGREESKDESYKMVLCRNKCGELYCSQECEEEMWLYGGHDLMCTGLIPDPPNESEANESPAAVEEYENRSEQDNGEMNNQLHPLLQFKVHAVQSNEIFLMVGDLVATVISLRRKQIESQLLHNETEYHSFDNCTLDDIMAPYLDFTLNPWWEVATDPLLSDSESVHLSTTLKELCSTSASLLKNAITSLISELEETEKDDENLFSSTLKQSIDECVEKYDIFSELFFGKIIGSFEQNALGIRARHPLCREIIENHSFRERGHTDILRCLELAGLIEDPEQEVQDNHIFINKDNDIEGLDEIKVEEDTWDEYNCDEIAGFIAGLQIDEDGYNTSNQQEDTSSKTEDKGCCDEDANNETEHERCCGEGKDCCDKDENDDSDGNENENEGENGGDDLDVLFTPLDGTAMYYTTCKMNHSCRPNVMVKYSYSCSGGGKRTRWGQKFPLVVSCNAIKDIQKGEELCISYINSDLSYEERSNALQNYGFKCNCSKCSEDMETCKISEHTNNTQSTNSDAFFDEDDDIFGSEDESEIDLEEKKVESGHCNVDDNGDDNNVGNNSDIRGITLLGQLERDLNKDFSITTQNSIPMKITAPTISFVLQMGSQILRNPDLDSQAGGIGLYNNKMSECLEVLLASLNHRDFIKALQVAITGEEIAMGILNENQGWPNIAYREAHRCFAIVAAIVYAKVGNFSPAMAMLDKALIFGLSRQKAKNFLEFIELHYSTSLIKHFSCISTKSIPDYRQLEFRNLIAKQALSAPLKYPIAELNANDCDEKFKQYFSCSEPVIIRSYADSWPAIQKWRQLNFFEQTHGNRVVPIEKGTMTETSGLKEQLMTLKAFTRTYLIPSSSQSVWPLEYSTQSSIQNSIAYLAQHPLFEQIPDLMNDLKASPSLCGEDGPSHVNAWIGTGGTRTPCHFDSYDNLLVQVVGVKYVRCFHPRQTNNLYVMKQSDTSYGKQGNISAVNCEMEDFSLHPMVKHAKYAETVLFPGDCLFIPSRYWHYVRSCTTSASVNFWF